MSQFARVRIHSYEMDLATLWGIGLEMLLCSSRFLFRCPWHGVPGEFALKQVSYWVEMLMTDPLIFILTLSRISSYLDPQMFQDPLCALAYQNFLDACFTFYSQVGFKHVSLSPTFPALAFPDNSWALNLPNILEYPKSQSNFSLGPFLLFGGGAFHSTSLLRVSENQESRYHSKNTSLASTPNSSSMWLISPVVT